MNRAERRKQKQESQTASNAGTEPKPITKQNKGENPPRRAWLYRIAFFMKTAFGAFMYVGGVVGVIFAFVEAFDYAHPKVLVSANVVDSQDPFSSSFEVSNDGHFEIRDVLFNCTIVKVMSERNIVLRNIVYQYNDVPAISIIPAGRKTTTKCAFKEDASKFSPIAYADIVVSASYRSTPWPSTTDLFRFEMTKAANGSWRWDAKL